MHVRCQLYTATMRKDQTGLTGWDAPMTTVSGFRNDRSSSDNMKLPVSSAPRGGRTSSISTCTSYRRSSWILSLGSGTSACGIGRSRDLLGWCQTAEHNMWAKHSTHPYVNQPSTSTTPPVPHDHQKAPTASMEKTAEERRRNPRRTRRNASDIVRGERRARLMKRRGTVTLF